MKKTVLVTQNCLPSPALSLCPAVDVAALVALMLHGGDDAGLGTDPISALTPLSHGMEAPVLGSRTVLLTCTCTGNVAFQVLLLVMLCSLLGLQIR
jgi:hypothetical protein